MKLKLASFELAKKLKEIGFTYSELFGYVTIFYEPSNGTVRHYGFHGRTPLNKLIYAPTLELVKMWFRDIHKIQIISQSNDLGWYWYIEDLDGNIIIDMEVPEPLEGFKSYEEALEEGLIAGYALCIVSKDCKDGNSES